MSDVPSQITDTAIAAQNLAEPSTPIWPFVVGTICALIIAGFFIYKRLNRPSFLIKQIRKRNMKAMAKQGIENNEAMVDLDKLLTSVEKYATNKKMSGTETVTLLKPLNDQQRLKTAKDMYDTMQYIAKEIGDHALANELKQRISGAKSNSRLMAGLFKRAGI